jgi:GT2 family glycosyltransferase
MKYAVAILTYSTPEFTQSENRLIDALVSLYGSGYKGRVIVVDDGSIDRDWGPVFDAIPDDIDFDLVFKGETGGISRGKNTCIRVLMEEGIDVGFLADDDVVFFSNWWESYLWAHRITDIAHFSWALPKLREKDVKYKNYPVTKCSGLNGCLLTFTPKVVDIVGGFSVTPVRWGYDHVNWTNRIIKAGLCPFFVDVVDGLDCIGLNQFSSCSAVSLKERRKMRNYTFPKIGSIYQDLIE